MRGRGILSRFFLAGIIAGGCVLPAGCAPVEPVEQVVFVYPLEREIETLNTAAYPERHCVVAKGDTPRGIAEREGVDFESFAEANGLDEDSKPVEGDILVIPLVARRGPEMISTAAAEPTARVAQGASGINGTEAAVSDGIVRAASAGTVTAVFRGYTSLGDVVIIENETEKVIYSGAFEPTVAKGASVSQGDRIGKGAAGGVKVRPYGK